MKITADKAQAIAEKMTRCIDGADLLDWKIYDPIAFDDPVEGIKETIIENPLAVMELLIDILEDYT